MKDKRATFFVLGPGRCGTSTTARILHNHFNICMGEHFAPADERNKDGYYEDLEFKSPNDLFLNGNLFFTQYLAILEREMRKRKGKIWGLKDPRLCYLLGFYLSIADNPIFIRCTRDPNKVADSMAHCYNWNRDYAVRLTLARERHLNKILSDRKVCNISFDVPRSDDEIIKKLRQQISCLS